jgi:hypothetical protein
MIRLFFLLVLGICSISVADEPEISSEAMESLLMKVREERALNDEDREVLKVVWDKYEKSSPLDVVEDNIVFYYLRNQNAGADKVAHPIFADWLLYRRFDKCGWKIVAEHLSGDNVIHEFISLAENEPSPQIEWNPSRLQVVWVSGEEPLRRIKMYDIEKAAVETIAEGLSDNYSVSMAPGGRYAVFLSDRNKHSRKDNRVSLFAQNLDDLKEDPFEIYSLGYYIPNLKWRDENLHFKNRDILVLKPAKGDPIEIDLYKNLQKARDQREKNISGSLEGFGFNRAASNQNIDLVGDFRRDISTEKIPRGKIELYQYGGKTILEINHHDKGRVVLSTVTNAQYDDRMGYFWKRYGDILLFLRTREELYEVWTFDLRTFQVRQISKSSENCAGFGYNPALELVGYILSRGERSFVIVHDYLSGATVDSIQINGVNPAKDEEQVRVDGRKKIYFLNFVGEYSPARVVETVTNKSRLQDLTKMRLEQWESEEEMYLKLAASQIKPVEEKTVVEELPAIQTPYLMDYSVGKEVKSETGDSDVEGLWTAAQLSLAISEAENWLLSINDNEELTELMKRYNVLHLQVRLRMKKWGDTKKNPFQNRMLTRWILKLNQLKRRLDSLAVLFQEE